MRIAICAVVTILLFGSTRYTGPTRSFDIEDRVGSISLHHEAPRFNAFAIESDRDLSDDAIGELGQCSLLVTAEPAPTGSGPFPLHAQWRVRGSETWTDPAPPVITPVEGGRKAECRFDIPGHRWTTRLQYRFLAIDGDGTREILRPDDRGKLILKFKGPVPGIVLIPHIVFMFIGICLLMVAMWRAVDLMRGRDAGPIAGLAASAWGAMFIGGVPFGVLMNYYAFDVFWEAVPFGHDVTDNKTQVALVFWGLAALVLRRQHPGRHAGLFTLTAGVLALAMYLIPHSL